MSLSGTVSPLHSHILNVFIPYTSENAYFLTRYERILGEKVKKRHVYESLYGEFMGDFLVFN